MTSTYHTPAQQGMRAAHAENSALDAIAATQRKAERLLAAAEIAEKLLGYGYGIDRIEDGELTVFSDTFQTGRDGYLDERAEREIRNRTWTVRDKIRSIFVDHIRPEGLVRIVVK